MTAHQLKGHIFDFMDSKLASIVKFIGSMTLILGFMVTGYKYIRQAEEQKGGPVAAIRGASGDSD